VLLRHVAIASSGSTISGDQGRSPSGAAERAQIQESLTVVVGHGAQLGAVRAPGKSLGSDFPRVSLVAAYEDPGISRREQGGGLRGTVDIEPVDLALIGGEVYSPGDIVVAAKLVPAKEIRLQ